MQKNEVLLSEKQEVMWRQVVRNRSDALIGNRSVIVRGDLSRLVYEFAEYCVESRGDRYSSVGLAMNEINAQSRGLLAQVSVASTQTEVESAGLLLETAVGLFKALEAYYISNFSSFDLRTGTAGD